MDMHKKDEQLLRSFCDERGLKDVTYESYATTIGLYSRYHKKPFYQLLKEAEKEEKKEVKWKHSQLRVRLIAFRNHLMKKGHLATTVKNYVSRVMTVYEESFDIEIGKFQS